MSTVLLERSMGLLRKVMHLSCLHVAPKQVYQYLPSECRYYLTFSISPAWSDCFHSIELMVSLVTVSQVINFSVLCLTYLRFYEGLKAQNIDRRTLPYRGWFQPYGAWIGLVCCLFMALISGWSVFVYWDLTTFVFAYVMIPICVLIYVGWKIWSGCKFIKAGEMDLQTGIKEIENHETRWVEPEKARFGVLEVFVNWLVKL